MPFTEFMRGMQNDRAMPTPEEGFNPIFIAFIWPALPLEFTSSQDALTRTQLLAQFENEHPATDASTDIAQAAEAAAQALEVNDPDHPQLNNGLHRLAEASKDEIGPDEHVEQMINRLKTEAAEGVEEEKDDDGNIIVGGVTNILRAIMGPFETLVFSRLMRRGQATGEVMGRLIGKFMRASTGHLKVCLMANSLGVHVLCGVLNNPDNLPYKLHTVFHVQGAIRSDLFSPSERFGSLHHNVAGPVVCTFSEHDRLLRIMFGLFHGPAVGLGGSPVGRKIVVKGLDELANTPYEFLCGHWNNVDCSKYVCSISVLSCSSCICFSDLFVNVLLFRTDILMREAFSQVVMVISRKMRPHLYIGLPSKLPLKIRCMTSDHCPLFVGKCNTSRPLCHQKHV